MVQLPAAEKTSSRSYKEDESCSMHQVVGNSQDHVMKADYKKLILEHARKSVVNDSAVSCQRRGSSYSRYVTHEMERESRKCCTSTAARQPRPDVTSLDLTSDRQLKLDGRTDPEMSDLFYRGLRSNQLLMGANEAFHLACDVLGGCHANTCQREHSKPNPLCVIRERTKVSKSVSNSLCYHLTDPGVKNRQGEFLFFFVFVFFVFVFFVLVIYEISFGTTLRGTLFVIQAFAIFLRKSNREKESRE